MNNIKLYGKNLLKCKMEYINIQDKEIKKILEYLEPQILWNCYIKQISQYYIDCTYKCIQPGLENTAPMMVLLGYNNSLDKFNWF